MLFFENDYAEGAHPEVLCRLTQTNLQSCAGYGADDHCTSAREKIRAACHTPGAEIFFLVGGTQTNRVVISSMLSACESVISAATGHIHLHEAGAIEAGGHKVLTLPHHEGKLDAAELARYLEAHFADENRAHTVQPGMVYLSHPTEYGTLYSKSELQAIAAICKRFSLPLYLDGARLGYALASPQTDLTLADIAALCNVFYIGGTKVGALCGEALVFPDPHDLPRHFVSQIKQNGALLAKGRVLGVQFDALFTDGLYLKIGRHAIDAAMELKAMLQKYRYPFYLDSHTNQQFVILKNTQLQELRKTVRVSCWESIDTAHTVVRFVTSWATTARQLQELDRILEACATL